jgi:hypothetical protein
MADLKGGILHVVANPKQFLFAPFEMAIINMILSIAFMLLCIAVIKWTPFVAIVPLILGHTMLIGLGAKNQHLTNLIQSSGKYPRFRKNLSPVSRGVKFVP